MFVPTLAVSLDSISVLPLAASLDAIFVPTLAAVFDAPKVR
jgi:hypothetical protein